VWSIDLRLRPYFSYRSMTEVRKGAYRFDWQYEKSLLSQNKYMNEDCNNISIGRNVVVIIRRNSIIAACLDIANLMERGGTGFQTMLECYKDSDEHLQPVVSIYPGFLNLRLFDRLFDEHMSETIDPVVAEKEKIIYVLKTEGPKTMKELQAYSKYKSRSQFLREIITPLLESNIIFRDGNVRSPRSLIRLK